MHLTHAHRTWDDGAFSDIVSLRFSPEGFTFVEIDQGKRAVKLSEIAYLRGVKAQARGVTDPRVVVFARFWHYGQEVAILHAIQVSVMARDNP